MQKIFLIMFFSLISLPVLGADCNQYLDSYAQKALELGNYSDFQVFYNNGNTSIDSFMKSWIVARRNESISKINNYKQCLNNQLEAQQATVDKLQQADNQTQQYFTNGNNSYKKGDYLDAINQYKRALSYRPGETTILNNLWLSYHAVCNGYFAKADYDSMIKYANEGLTQFPNDPDLLTLMGTAYMDKHSYSTALDYFQKALVVMLDVKKIQVIQEAIVYIQSKLQPITITKVNNTNTSNNSELESAILWMYDNGLTSYNTIDTFMGEDYLTREQASKFFVLFAKNILNKTIDTQKTVSFSDLKIADKTLQSYIKEASQLGLFNGVKGKFLPFNKLTIAQSLAVMIRSIDGNQNEKGTKRYNEYYNIANDYGILNGLGFDFDSLDLINIKRNDVALLLYRLTNNNSITK